ncbi:hypothetical protein DRN67_04545 [Candidatus Micrarchaeota archaeon]|nr:MAG: hypothetical protein DRN67_04545 [Candidatus Micrarchaeota archaeon]
MRQTGELQLEAIICLACFLALLGIALQAIGQIAVQSDKAAEAVNAKSSSLMCSTLVDSAYSNNTTQIRTERLPCIVQGREVKSTREQSVKHSFFLPQNVRLVQMGGQTTFSVELSEHYS